ncbi:hypothetical protein OIE50_50790 [Streptomyces canus]|uniref:hypothetical protein n=1 Tax=Streptomyces canus TaxID=58343 RepID=UPI0032437370
MAGDVHITIYHQGPAGQTPARSVYQRQVELIAPPTLLDRQAELAELAAFCTDEHRGPYVWWQADSWAGKSALLSTFVLNNPLAARRIHVVSFFITARLADTWDSFTTAVTEQLCTLLGQAMPTGGHAAARESTLLDLLAQAAAACRQAGGRLVLVVDGLDEDLGVTAGRGAHSIAGLLPGRTPDGMRVIVTGRSNPPVPEDVPAWHPLRDPSIIRTLTDSPHAQDLQRLSQLELKNLLTGSPLEQDILGLLAVARGGLSGHDLRELTGADLVVIEEVLHTVTGRAFSRRPATWAPATGPQAYLLGHQELLRVAHDYLGEQRLTDYRERLHTWADGYRVPDDGGWPWPPDTPEYLLSGYLRMLTIDGDIARRTALTVDAARQDRMLDLSGGDTAALAEIKSCEEALLNLPEPDLCHLAELAHHRCRLEARNSWIPVDLPAVWAVLGQVNRAEALAQALEPTSRVKALTTLVEAVAEAGDFERAGALARDITDLQEQTWTLTRLAEAAVAAGHVEQALALARAVPPLHHRVRALERIAEAMVSTGDVDRAIAFARTISHPHRKEAPLMGVALAIAKSGDVVRAEALARTFTDVHLQAETLTWIAAGIAGAGELHQAEVLVRTIADAAYRTRALAQLADKVVRVGAVERADAFARALTDPDEHAKVLSAVAVAMVRTGHVQRADALARTLTSPWDRVQVLNAMADAMGYYDDNVERAGAFARSLTDPYEQESVLPRMAAAMARAGHVEQAEALARTLTDPRLQTGTLAKVAESVKAHSSFLSMPWGTEKSTTEKEAEEAAGAGDIERAVTLARSLTDLRKQAHTLAEIAVAAARAGHTARAAELAVDADAIDRTPTSLRGRATNSREGRTGFNRPIAAPKVAEALAQAGDLKRAEALARTLTHPPAQARTLTKVSAALARAGHTEQAAKLAIEAETLARTPTAPWEQTRAVAQVATAVVVAGDVERAQALARTLTDPYAQTQAVTQVAKAAVAAGDMQRAEVLADSLTDTGKAAILLAMAVAAAAVGDLDRAETLACAIPHPHERDKALDQVTLAAAATCHVDQIKALARMHSHPYWQVETLARVARSLAESGDPQRARELATDAETLARGLTDAGQQAHLLIQVAEAALIADDRDQALRLAAEAKALAWASKPYRDEAMLVRVAVVAARAGDVEQAEEVARRHCYGFSGRQGVAQIAAAVAEAGDARLAETLARTLTDEYAQKEALTLVAKAAAAAGHVKQAEALARTLPDKYAQKEALGQVAEAAVRAGYVEQAESLARRLDDSFSRPRVLAQVVKATAEDGNVEKAHAVARALGDGESKDEALTWVATAVARTGDAEQAAKIARSIGGPKQRTQALLEIAQTIGAPSASRFIAEAFTLGSWLTPLPVLAKLYPAEMIRIADAVYLDQPAHDAR